MGMQSYTESGIGFPLFTENNAADILEFFKNHEKSFQKACVEKTYKEVYSALDELKDKAEKDGVLDNNLIYDGLCDIFDYNTAGNIAVIMNCENDVFGFEGFQAQDECETEETVIYTKAYQWQMTEKEKDLTEEDIRSILRKYASELNIPESSVEEQFLEYYG